MKLVNLTPHELRFFTNEGNLIKLSPSGVVARVDTHAKKIKTIDIGGTDLPIYSVTYSNVNHIPEPEEGTIYVVSSIVAMHANRDDVMSPNTSKETSIRDSNGYLIGVNSLQTF